MSLAGQVLQQLVAARAGEVRQRQFVSGAALATRLGVSRTAVWKAIGQLRNWGTHIEALPRQGYRLALPASPLDADEVRALLMAPVHQRLRTGSCVTSVDSTNTVLLQRGPPPPGQFDFLTAEHQGAGRGRHGRRWLASPGSAICLSWSWTFPALPAHASALALVVGIAARRALARCDVHDVQLKWPNDLVTAQGKLGGILIEMRSEATGPVHTTIGIGLNVAIAPDLRAHLDPLGQNPTDLCTLLGEPPPGRSLLTAMLLQEGVQALLQFGVEGLAPFHGAWQDADALRGRAVRLHGAVASGAPDQGVARGIDADGALLVEAGGRIQRIVTGEISVRTVAP